MFLYFILLILHVLSAMIWVGGMIFYVIVFIPVIRNPELKDQKLRLLQLTAIQFRNISYFIFAIFIFSGTGILYLKGFFQNGINWKLWASNIGFMFIAKIGLFTVLFLSSLYHDFVTGPKTFTYLTTDPVRFERYRKTSSFFGRFNLLVSLTIAIFGIFVSRGFSIF
ncbi:hypothetical protein [Leptospira bandrabouensis]|uniref:hypothetical protein n=1 Tax=Leptospira bandrabouensis TaxID=2484903 RepID=UPI001EE79100|nr:hypothetical protein [Leptospira bandrabouensis]MCG6143590.1 hypothetical protein [Leptospira bandrabouensis]MCG6151370.1 hypothetical protein [Leptospira bandrabouensis]MCG6159250.1 hypothetical protein [Leptospira bandrabouensis]MCG6163184.1 hypothetical protein [Leptospira bandrabouensis]